MAGAMRFNALALHEEASRIAEAGGHALAAEEAHFEELIAAAVAARNAIAETAMALALDVAAGRPSAPPRMAGAARPSAKNAGD
jgi:DNA mismatch repair protein MutS